MGDCICRDSSHAAKLELLSSSFKLMKLHVPLSIFLLLVQCARHKPTPGNDLIGMLIDDLADYSIALDGSRPPTASNAPSLGAGSTRSTGSPGTASPTPNPNCSNAAFDITRFCLACPTKEVAQNKPDVDWQPGAGRGITYTYTHNRTCRSELFTRCDSYK